MANGFGPTKPVPGHVTAFNGHINAPSRDKPIANRNTSGATSKRGRRPQTVPNEFIYQVYP